MDFTILSHAGLRVRHAGRELVCDPWLVGSCYWRSWWNYPPVARQLVDALAPDFVYLTHFHWDHFQGDSLRRLGTHVHVLIPREPAGRMRHDLADMGFATVTELDHARPFRVGADFVVTSYHFGHHMTDSALVIEAGGVTLLDANDAKLMGGPLRQLLDRHAPIDFLLRSHSSANPRACFEWTDAAERPADDNESYIEDFLALADAVQPRYAIPFASNQCYLHPATERFNAAACTPDMVVRRAGARGTRYDVRAMVSGDSFDTERGFDVVPNTWFSDRATHLRAYRERVAPKLAATEARERRTPIRLEHVERYFGPFLAALAWPLRRLFQDRPFVYRVRDASGGTPVEKRFVLDVYRRTIVELAAGAAGPHRAREICLDAAVMRQCIAKKIFSHLGISKRVTYRSRADERWLFELWFTLTTAYENELLPLRGIEWPRFVACWLRRWREPLLYLRILAVRLARGRARYDDFLPARPDGVAQQPAAEAGDR